MLPKNLKHSIKEEFNIAHKTERNEIFKMTKSICNKISCLITTFYTNKIILNQLKIPSHIIYHRGAY